MRSPLLSREILRAFEIRLHEMGAAAVLDRLAPGLSDAEIADLEGDLGLTLPHEARVWWRWRNGGAEVMPNVTMISLSQSIVTYHARREQAREAARDFSFGDRRLENPDLWWKPSWLPWVGPFGTQFIALDCDVPAGSASALRRPDWTRVADADYDAPRAGSIGAVVEHWTKLLVTDRVVFDATIGDWQWISLNEVLCGERD